MKISKLENLNWIFNQLNDFRQKVVNCRVVLPSFTEEYNYDIFASQTNLALTKFILNNIMSPIKFTTKIYFITNLIVLILYHKYQYFLYMFSQTLSRLTPQKIRVVSFYGQRSMSYWEQQL